jgi:hypothetical protein
MMGNPIKVIFGSYQLRNKSKGEFNNPQCEKNVGGGGGGGGGDSTTSCAEKRFGVILETHGESKHFGI